MSAQHARVLRAQEGQVKPPPKWDVSADLGPTSKLDIETLNEIGPQARPGLPFWWERK